MSKNDFNATINLPKTDFPMRAGLAKREPEMLQHWYDMDLYHEMLKKNDGKPRFSLHDGPPFSNGDIHMGHALNKALKDFIIRSYAMRGYYTPYIPGWDNHGMPIESAIIKEQRPNFCLKRSRTTLSKRRWTSCSLPRKPMRPPATRPILSSPLSHSKILRNWIFA